MLKRIIAVTACVSLLAIIMVGCNTEGNVVKKNEGNPPAIEYISDDNFAKEIKKCETLINDNKKEPALLIVAYAHAWNYSLDNMGDGWQSFLTKIRNGTITASEIPSALSADSSTLVDFNKRVIEMSKKRDEIFSLYEKLSKPSEANESKFKNFAKIFKKYDALFEQASIASGSYNDYVKDFASATKGFIDDVKI